MKRFALIMLTVLLLSISAFEAWQRQYEAKLEVEKILNERLLQGTILRANVYQPVLHPDTTGFLFVVAVKNPSQTDTLADHWSLKVAFPGETNEHDTKYNASSPGQHYYLTNNDNSVSIYSSDDDLEAKASNAPIPKGGKITGIISFGLVGANRQSIPLGTQFKLEFKDVFGTNYICGGYTNFAPENVLETFTPIPGLKP